MPREFFMALDALDITKVVIGVVQIGSEGLGLLWGEEGFVLILQLDIHQIACGDHWLHADADAIAVIRPPICVINPTKC